MSNVVDVAEQVLARLGPMDSFRLQKLVYYAQAVHLAAHDDPLFRNRIEGWPNGPCVPDLFTRHSGRYTVSTVGGEPSALSDVELESVERALAMYGHHSSDWLVVQTHLEDPWRETRTGLKPKQVGHREISAERIKQFYRPILNDPEVSEALEAAANEDGLSPDEIRARYLA